MPSVFIRISAHHPLVWAAHSGSAASRWGQQGKPHPAQPRGCSRAWILVPACIFSNTLLLLTFAPLVFFSFLRGEYDSIRDLD